MVEIRDAGSLGKGVFAKAGIARRTVLGEYLGELLPWSWPSDYEDYYGFDVPEVYTISKSPKYPPPQTPSQICLGRSIGDSTAPASNPQVV